MATVEEILSNAAGNPTTGLIKEIIPSFAEAIEANFEVKARDPKETPPKEHRVVSAPETRQATVGTVDQSRADHV
jgi:hypothetical protein